MIERQTINGRPATIAYLDSAFNPASKDDAAFAKLNFDDGEMIFLSTAPMAPAYTDPNDTLKAQQEASAWNSHRARHREPLIAPPLPPSEPPPHVQLGAWAKAIMILDASEIMVRDVIERELSSIATMRVASADVQAVTDRLMRRVSALRTTAIKVAFRSLRTRLGDDPVLDKSLAAWAQYFAREDLKNIETAIRTGLIAGLDNTEIARKVVGSMGLNGVDGVTEFTRHKIGHLGRAAIKASILRKREG
jgi:hypothetical protein